MRNLLLHGLSLILLLLANAAHAQLASGHLSSQDGTLTLRTPDGALFVADLSTQRIYASTPNGTLSEITFEDAVAAAEPDPANRPALLAAFNSVLGSQNSNGAFALPILAPAYPPCTDNGANPGGWEEECQLEGLRGHHSTLQSENNGPELDEPTDLPGVEVLGMRPNYFPSGGSFYVADSLGNYQNVDGNVSYSELFAYDFHRWNKNRSAACDAAQTQSFIVGGSITGTVGTCAIAVAASGPTAGFAFMACGGALVVTGAAWGQMLELNKTCVSEYPGPNNW
jgi:hypothetical protein